MAAGPVTSVDPPTGNSAAKAVTTPQTTAYGRVHQSGRRRGQPALSKHGDAELRRLLYLAALAASRTKHDRTFARRYTRERAKGLATTAALNAVARKLAKVAWSLVAHRTTYDPDRVDTQPPPPTTVADTPALTAARAST